MWTALRPRSGRRRQRLRILEVVVIRSGRLARSLVVLDKPLFRPLCFQGAECMRRYVQESAELGHIGRFQRDKGAWLDAFRRKPGGET